MEETFGNYTINDQRSTTDRAFAHRELKESYWSKNIPYEIVSKGIDHSLCFNVFAGTEQVAFARVITDTATYAYLCDVIVTEAHRGRGIGKALMAFILKHPDLQGLRRFTLATKDAHGLYEQFGFHTPKIPDRWMEIVKPGIYESGAAE
jgi:GNAT superfamily N-acetyltransferase